VYEKLGPKNEDEQAKKARECDDSSVPSVLQLDVPADLDYGDGLPHEIDSLCDWKNPEMKLGCRYKGMPTFRLGDNLQERKNLS
jgi:hypothetical protein